MRKMIPVELVLDQLRADRFCFLEAVRRANEAIRQRDAYREEALRARCELMSSTRSCPDDNADPCPLFFGEKCKQCLDAVDETAVYRCSVLSSGPSGKGVAL